MVFVISNLKQNSWLRKSINLLLVNEKISNEQLVTIGYASQILSMGEDLQAKIIELNHSSIEETKDKFIDIWDEFKNFGCFVDI